MSKASEAAYQIIRSKILSGEFSEGSHLKEEELAGICKVSRTPIRDALRKLAADYYVKFVPNHGAFVTQWSKDDVEDIFNLRAMIEGYAARRAAEHVTDEEIAALSDCCDRIAAILERPGAFDNEGYFTENRRFHNVLRYAGRSERVAASLDRLVQQPVVMRTVISYSRDDFTRSNEHHREIIEALKSHDGAWAEAVMRSHIHAAYHVYRRAYNAAIEQEESSLGQLNII